MAWLCCWNDGDKGGDMDLYFCSNLCASGSDYGADNYGAATSSKPESETFTIPAGQTWWIQLDRYSPAFPADLVQLTVTGF